MCIPLVKCSAYTVPAAVELKILRVTFSTAPFLLTPHFVLKMSSDYNYQSMDLDDEVQGEESPASNEPPNKVRTRANHLSSDQGRATLNPITYKGPPIVLNIPALARSFAALSGEQRKRFMVALQAKVGRPYNTKIARRGELFVQPHTELQKRQLLDLTSLDEFQVKCEKTKAEKEDHGVIQEVPIDIPDDYLKTHLSSQDVVDIKRKRRYEAEDRIVPTTTVILAFSSSRLPTSVNIDGVN